MPVATRLPFAVHLTAASMVWGGVIVESLLLMASQRTSGLTQSFSDMPRCARSTTRLGLGGLAPATAEYVHEGVGVLLLLIEEGWGGVLLEVVDGF